MKTRKLLNATYSKAFPWVYFFDVLRAQIEQIEEHDLLLFVEGAWCGLNAQSPKAAEKRH